MRPKLQRWIPKEAHEIFEHPQGLGVCYLYSFMPYGSPGKFGAVGYGGNRTKHDFHYSYKNRELAMEQITGYLNGLTLSAQAKVARRQERKQETADPNNPSLTETAQLVREALAQGFPKTKFSVRSDSYSMGCSIDVHWTDGPTQSQVEKILDAFERCGFDGMQDLKTYNPPSIYKGRTINFGADYVQGSRSISNELLKDAARRVAFECDLPLLFINDRGSIEGGDYRVPWKYHNYNDGNEGFWSDDQGEWYAQLVYKVAHATSTEEQQPVELPRLKTREEMTHDGNAKLAKAIFGEESEEAKVFENIEHLNRMVN
jgi:hypothetical protein